MKQLRNAIMRAFILYFLGLSIVGDITNELITELDSWVFGAEYQVITPMIAGMLQILMVLLFSFLFYRSLNKKIEKES
ncbi:MAG: sensor histidine kinase, partial [Enterococcus gilvus]